MKTYPSIPTTINPDISYHVFDKLDGSNIRAEWTAINGFHRFGSRTQLLSQGDTLAASTILILEKYGESLERVFSDESYQKATCFFEYFGPESFAGDHPDPLEKMDVVLFDVNPHRKGILGPGQFLKLFGHLQTPEFFGERRLDPRFVDAVRSGSLKGVSGEGVVCKALHKNQLKMTKIKSRSWLARLRAECRDEAEFTHRA